MIRDLIWRRGAAQKRGRLWAAPSLFYEIYIYHIAVLEWHSLDHDRSNGH